MHKMGDPIARICQRNYSVEIFSVSTTVRHKPNQKIFLNHKLNKFSQIRLYNYTLPAQIYSATPVDLGKIYRIVKRSSQNTNQKLFLLDLFQLPIGVGTDCKSALSVEEKFIAYPSYRDMYKVQLIARFYRPIARIKFQEGFLAHY